MNSVCAVKSVRIRGQCSTPGRTHAILPNQPRGQVDKNHFLPFLTPIVCSDVGFFEPINDKMSASSQQMQQVKSLDPLLSASSKSAVKTKDASITQPFPHSLWDELLRGKRSRVIQQLSTGNPLDCSLPPDNEWEVSLSILLNDLL